MRTEKDLIDIGYKLIGTNTKGYKLYAIETAEDTSALILCEVSNEGYVTDMNVIAKETISMLYNSEFIVKGQVSSSASD